MKLSEYYPNEFNYFLKLILYKNIHMSYKKIGDIVGISTCAAREDKHQQYHNRKVMSFNYGLLEISIKVNGVVWVSEVSTWFASIGQIIKELYFYYI